MKLHLYVTRISKLFVGVLNYFLRVYESNPSVDSMIVISAEHLIQLLIILNIILLYNYKQTFKSVYYFVQDNGTFYGL